MSALDKYIGGRAVKCGLCERVWTTHSTVLIANTHWCNWCQRVTPASTWVFLEGDINSHACAAPQPEVRRTLMTPPGCSLSTDHDGDHYDNITRTTWPR